jgi:hypothetical protein
MKRPLGLRHALPLLSTLLQIGLVFYASGSRHQSQSETSNRLGYRVAALQENSVQWEPIRPKRLPTAEKLSIVLNLPAILLAIPIAVRFFPENDIGSLYAALPFVPLVWYCIGRWLDGVLGYIVRRHAVPRAVSGLSAVISTCLVVFGVLMLTPLNHHRTADTNWVGTAGVVWSGLFLAMSLSSFYRHASHLK